MRPGSVTFLRLREPPSFSVVGVDEASVFGRLDVRDRACVVFDRLAGRCTCWVLDAERLRWSASFFRRADKRLRLFWSRRILR